MFSADGKRIRTPIYDGTPLGAGATIKGPAVIEEITTPSCRTGLDRTAGCQRVLPDHPRPEGGQMSLSADKVSVAFAGLRALSEGGPDGRTGPHRRADRPERGRQDDPCQRADGLPGATEGLSGWTDSPCRA